MKPLEQGFKPRYFPVFLGEGRGVCSKRSVSHPYRNMESRRPPRAAGQDPHWERGEAAGQRLPGGGSSPQQAQGSAVPVF